MAIDRVKFQNIVQSQLPDYVQNDYPLLVDFLQQYYVSQEYQSGSYDIIQNIDQYVKVDELTNLKNSTILGANLDYTGTTITTSSTGNFTEGFPNTDGLIKIDDEIIYYEYKTNTTFENCHRGFSGVSSYTKSNTPDELVFEDTEAEKHTSGATIYNLNILFLQEFFKKLKGQFVPGFSERGLYGGLDQRNFIFNADSFYKSKGTDQSFEILFRALYGEDVEVIRPAEYLLRPSNADYRITQDIVVEELQGDPLQLKNLTLFQSSTNAQGTVTNVQKIRYDNYQYYQISIDSGYHRDLDLRGTLFSEFEPEPKTKFLTAVSVGSTILDVDSTVSFPESGTLTSTDLDGNIVTLTYDGKNDNQFFNVNGNSLSVGINKETTVRLNSFSYAYVGINTSEQIRVVITSALKRFKTENDTYYYRSGDKVKIQSLGIEPSAENSKNWKTNSQAYWNIDRVTLVDSQQNSYRFTTFDNQQLNVGNNILVTDVNNSSTYTGPVTRIDSSTSFVVSLNQPIDISHTFKVENVLLKGNSSRYPNLRKYVANVQNTYSKFNGDALVASNSIARYTIETNPYNKTKTFSGTFNSTEEITLINHGFYTGDAVYYEPKIIKTTTTGPDGIPIITETESKFENLDEGIVYVKRISDDVIKLSNSRANLFASKFIALTGTVTDNKIIYYDFYQKPLSPQSIYREILKPDNKSGNYNTTPGYTGILINGVEVINYKSSDSITYGDVQSFDVARGGEGYDVINPPIVVVSDSVGTGATGTAAINGSLERIEIIDQGFDYLKKPYINITGGSGNNAAAEVNISPIIHRVQFNAEGFLNASTSNGVGISSNIIGFSTYHKFRDNEKVVYNARGLTSVGGLSTEAFYYVNVVNSTTVTLHIREGDANLGINTVNITSLGSGLQEFKSSERKNIISSIVVTNPGSGYQNKKRLVPTNSGVSTSTNRINITNHGYSSKQIVKYESVGNDIEGLSTTKDYYVVNVNPNSFSLSEVGVGSTASDFYYDNNILVNLESTGSGYFNYKPITVTVEGVTGVSTRSDQNFACQIQPIFRGTIDSIDLTESGVGYGSSEIINFVREPEVTFFSGKNAVLQPIVVNGSISEILIINGGTGYNSPPDLVVNSDTGTYAQLTPIIRNGSIVEVKVIQPGFGYVSNKTTIDVLSAGQGCSVNTNIKKWTVNLFERDFSNIRKDDGFVETNINNTNTEYSHMYAPRPLRSSTYAISGTSEDNTLYGIPDLTIKNNSEVDSIYHSPIIGWAYDGNPIYGPFGFTNKEGGPVTRMKSGYGLNLTLTNRPPTNLYPSGFFIEDYKFFDNGDLDEHNGRFCVTPDYPNGVYAYFTTISKNVDSFGPFQNYKRPVFPYVIGNKFRSKPNIFNFGSDSNQNSYDVELNGWLRNTSSYHTNDNNSGYNYIFNSTKIEEQIVDITSATVGGVESVGIVTGGINYKVNDSVNFNNQGSGGRGATATVDKIKGKRINTVSTATTTFYDVEFTRNSNTFIGFNSTPHNLEQNDIIQISGLSQYFQGLDGTYTVGIRSDNFVLTLGVGTTASTGDVAYFYVSGSLEYPFIRENDILEINNEKIKVLNIDPKTERIRVLRAQEGTTGVAHSSRSILIEDPRKFRINVGSIKTDRTFNLNRELYFDPAESVGLGTVLGTGIGNTITFSNPGVGASQIFVQPQAIYYPDHSLDLNDSVSYSSNGGTSVQVWNGLSGVGYKNLNEFETLYIVPLSRDFIGLSSTKIGLSTSGTYTGINTTTGLFYFTNVGAGDTHSFKTNLSNVIKGEVSKNVVTVSTVSTHGLERGDKVFMSVNPTGIQTVTVQYNDFNRRIVFDPLTFTAGNVNVSLNTIEFSDNYFKFGDRVIHTSTSPSGGLVNNGMYYVIPYNDNSVRLVEDKYQLTSENPTFVNITSASSGTLSKINPLVNTYKNNRLKFDLSDRSLSFVSGGTRFSAFDFDLYTDKDYSNVFYTTETTTIFEVQKTGKIGISTNANLTLTISDNVPPNLYYKFTPTNLNFITDVKNEIVTDTTPSSYDEIQIIKTTYDGDQYVSGVGTTSFTFNTTSVPEVLLYNQNNSNSSYETNSTNVKGTISSFRILDQGNGYQTLPGITSIRSNQGSGAIIEIGSESIGKVLTSNFEKIGFDYPSDKTVRPVTNLPEQIRVSPLYSFQNIGISSNGVNYLVAPTLVVLDGFTNEVVDTDLIYQLGDTEVTIRKNAFGLYDTIPSIIPTQNSNGIGIASVTYNNSTKVVRLYLDRTFGSSSEFPFSTGKNVLVENLGIGIGSTGTGYNSADYNYSLFELTAAEGQFGGSGAYLEYNLLEYIGTNGYPGIVNNANSSGRVIPEEHFPIFDITLQENDFFVGEKVSSANGSNVGVVQRWNHSNEYLVVSAPKEFKVGERIIGQSSNTQALVSSKINFNSEIITGSGTTFVSGWQSNSGFLNNDFQRTSNNEYYQNLSYSLKSKVPYQTWNDAVSALNHTSGFGKFSDLVVESTDESNNGIVLPLETTIEFIVDIVGLGNLNCFYDFDYVTENTVNVNGQIVSDEILFENRILTDYFESIGNRVLSIDDFSSSFNSNERSNASVEVTAYTSSASFNKVFTYVKDQTYTNERQSSIVSVIQNKEETFIQEYGKLYTVSDLGYFESSFQSNEVHLDFFPIKYEYNEYSISVISFSIFDNITSIGSTDLGTVVSVASSHVDVPADTSTEIVSISDTNRSVKLLVQLQNDSNDYYVSELNVVHDGTDAYFLEYGDIETSTTSPYSGVGTFNARVSGGNLIIDFDPTIAGVAYTSDTSIISLATSVTGIGSTDLTTSRLASSYVSIASSTSPVANVITSYQDPFDSAYYILSIEDTTNSQYEMLEVSVLSTPDFQYYVDFANVTTGGSIGTVGLTTSTGDIVNLTYTPIANTAVEVRAFAIDQKIFDNNTNPTLIDLNNVNIQTSNKIYQGTKVDIRNSFGLTHDGLQIFQRMFDGSDSNIVDVTRNTVTIPNHFFVTGEKLVYTNDGTGTTKNIGIQTTTVSGVSTDKLPETVYVVKVDDANIRFAETAEKALALTPDTFTINSVGIGNSHFVTATNQNSKLLLAIDNMVQSPIVPSTITSSLDQNISFNVTFNTTGITSIFTNDFIQIDDEIMIVNSVGVGGPNRLNVRRAQMGTNLTSHTSGTTITKLDGNYNVVSNTLYLASAPYGNVPVGVGTTVNPDEVDWTGISTSSTFQGRVFLRSGVEGSSQETYSTNYVFDDISNKFTGIQSSFTLTAGGSNVTGISTDNSFVLIKGIVQKPQGSQSPAVQQGDFDLSEETGITTITFSGAGVASSTGSLPTGYDPNNGFYPRGGLIVSVGSTNGLGYQPLISAGGTATVSTAGTISAISIGNSGSGYRAGIQTVVNVGVQTLSTGTPNIEFIGTAAISGGHIVSVAITNPGTGYTSTNPPVVVFDDPLEYHDIPLVYSSDSVVGGGQSATIDIEVSMGSSIVNFTLNDPGFGYGNSEILTFNIGGLSGIPTDTSYTFEEFQLTIDQTYTDTFNGWSIGNLQVLNSLDSEFDGSQQVFNLSVGDLGFAAKAAKGSLVDIQQTLIVFINDVLQIPGVSYIFQGGSVIEFTEAPKEGDTSLIMFYKGTSDVDVNFVDILETVKIGDTLDINNNPTMGQGIRYDEDPRVVTGINTIDSVQTNPYTGPGIVTDRTLTRPVTWCRQTTDRIINGEKIGKSRIKYEPLVYPSAFILQSVGIGSTEIYVDTLRPLFDSSNEASDTTFQNKIDITSQDSIVSAAATAIVSIAGTISSLNITTSGVGYTEAPSVTIGNPVGLGSTARASATASLSGDSVSSLTVTSPGSGYTTTNPPQVLIESPKIITTELGVSDYSGDYGLVVGVGTDESGSQNQFYFDLFIPEDSYMRQTTYVGTAVTISELSVGDYLTIFDTNVTIGQTFAPERTDGSSIGIGTTFVDAVYQVNSQTVEFVNIPGVGSTYVNRVVVNVDSFGSGIAYTTTNTGQYSWGKIIVSSESDRNFNFYGNDGYNGISTSGLITRNDPLRYDNYL